ncbi:MAG: HNH endonuclease signature motif containing protein [Acidobacteriaceae bacterium]
MYSRDPRVREVVLRRANGQCEFCGELGFVKPDGARYLESHHMIALANDGEDRLTNVIALCPNDHREAHFGERRNEIEIQKINKVKILKA